MTVRHFTISRKTRLPLGRAWRITETDGLTDRSIKEYPDCHVRRDTALAALAYRILAETPGPIVIHINEHDPS